MAPQTRQQQQSRQQDDFDNENVHSAAQVALPSFLSSAPTSMPPLAEDQFARFLDAVKSIGSLDDSDSSKGLEKYESSSCVRRFSCMLIELPSLAEKYANQRWNNWRYGCASKVFPVVLLKYPWEYFNNTNMSRKENQTNTDNASRQYTQINGQSDQ